MIKIIKKCNLNYKAIGDIIDNVEKNNSGIIHRKNKGKINIVYKEKYYHIDIEYQKNYTKYTIYRREN